MDVDSYDRVFLPFENTIATSEACPAQSWRKDIGPVDTTRFTNIILSTDLYKLQDDSGVLADILDIHPDFVQPNDLIARKDIQLNWVANQRYWWDLECELEPGMSSKSFYATLQKIPTYFELHDQQTKQPTFGLALDATQAS